MNQDKVIPAENLMDSSIDDLQDLPAFEVPPLGTYRLALTLERKEVNDHPAITAQLTVIETLELSDQNAKQPEPGAKFSQLFLMDNEYGQGGFKEFAKPIAAGLGMTGATIGKLVAAAQNVQIEATVKHRVHKEDRQKPKEEQRIYANLTGVKVA